MLTGEKLSVVLSLFHLVRRGAMARGPVPRRREHELANIMVLATCCVCLCASGSCIAREREVNGTVHQSVLLATFYSTPATYSNLKLKWYLRSNPTPFVELTRSNCSPYSDGSGYNCSDHWLVAPSHTGRIHLYPENGSLLIRDLRPSDSGVYRITVYSGGSDTAEDNVRLTVFNETESVVSTSTTPTLSPLDNTPIIATAVPVCLVVFLAICLSLLMVKPHRGCHLRGESDATETFVQFHGVSGRDTNEAQQLNSQLEYETLYCFLQFPQVDSSTAADESDTSIVYAVPQKVH